jgi:hypothetical protein
MTDAVVEMILKRYMELFEQITGRKFDPAKNASKAKTELEEKIKNALKSL